jgi:hypothetical protein
MRRYSSWNLPFASSAPFASFAFQLYYDPSTTRYPDYTNGGVPQVRDAPPLLV